MWNSEGESHVGDAKTQPESDNGGGVFESPGKLAEQSMPSVTVSFEAASYNVAEGATATVTIVLSEVPERSLTIPLTSSRQQGIALDDYSGVPGNIVFGASDTESTFTFAATQDDIDDDGEGLKITLGPSLPEGVSSASPMQTIVNIVDDDTAGVTLTPPDLEVLEGSSSSYSVVLDSQPTHDVTITINSPPASEIVALLPRLSFKSTDWYMPQSVTVFANPDRDKVNDSGTITHSIDSLDNSYGRISPAGLVVTIIDDDVPSITVNFARSAYTVTEGGTASVEVVLSADPERALTIPITRTYLGGATTTDLMGIPDSVAFEPGDTRLVFELLATDDDVDDDGESVTLGFEMLPYGVSVGTESETTIAIQDNDSLAVSVSFEKSNYSVQEGSNVSVKLELSDPPARSIAIPIISTALGGATSTDYSGVPDSLVFGQSDTEKSFTFSATDDSLNDDSESVRLSIADLPDGVVAGATSSAIVSIVDDDFPTVSVSFERSMYSVAEGETASIEVSLSAAPERSVTIMLSRSSQGGISLDDYSSVPESIAFGPGDTGQVFTFSAIGDHIDDDGEALMVSFVTPLPPGITLGVPSATTVHIADDDLVGVTIEPPVLLVVEQATTSFSVVLDSQPTHDVTITINLPSGSKIVTDKPRLTFTPNDWHTAQKVIVTANPDSDTDDYEGAITHTVDSSDGKYDLLTLGPLTVTVIDDDVPSVAVSFEQSTYSVLEGGTTSVKVVLDKDPERAVTIPIVTTGSGGANSTDYSGVPDFVDFSAGETEVTFTFEATQDTVDDDGESAILTFGELPEAVSEGATTETTVTIVDDDVPSVAVSFGQSSYSVAEGGTTTVTVSLDRDPERRVTIAIAKMEQGGATADDYIGVPVSVGFSAGETEKAFIFTAVDDSLNDDGESVALRFGDLPDGVAAGTIDEAMVSIVDDDVPLVSVSFEKSAYIVAEGSTTTVKILLDKDPERALKIPINRIEEGGATEADYTGVPDFVSFSAGQTESSFTFAAVQDNQDDDGESIRLTFGVLPDGVVAGSIAEATVRIEDDDVPSVSVSFEKAMYSVAEGATTSVNVRLSADPERSVTITFVKSPQGGVSLDDYSGVPESIDFAPEDTEQSFTFSATDDRMDDDGESLGLSFTSNLPTGVTIATHSRTTFHIVDDDATGVTIEPAPLRVVERATTSYSVVLDSQPTHEVTITINTPSGAKVVTDRPRLTFTPNDWHISQEVIVTANPDRDADDYEGTITHTVDSSDAKYDRYTPGPLAVIVIDIDFTLVAVSFSQTSYTVAEGSTTSVNIVLDKVPERTVAMPIVTTGSGGATSTDYSGVPDFVEFNADETEVAFTFSATQDTVDDDGESVTLTFGELPEAVSEGARQETTVSIVDDDVPSVRVSFGRAQYSVAEGASTTVKVLLDGDPERSLTVPITVSEQGGASAADYVPLPDSVSFSPGEVEKGFTVTAVNDSLNDDGESLALTFGILPEGATAGTPDAAVVSIMDDDVPSVTVRFEKVQHFVAEGSTTTVKVLLNKDPERTLNIPINRSEEGGATAADYSGVPDFVSFDAEQTESAFTFVATQDLVDDDGESIRLTFGDLPDEVAAGSMKESTVHIEDDDARSVSVSFEQPTYSVAEGATTSVKVRLSDDPGRSVNIVLAKSPQGGIALDDYSGVPESITFGPGEREHTFTFSASGDRIDDDGEALRLAFTSPLPEGVTVGTYGQTFVHIADDDVAGVTVQPAPLRVEERATTTYSIVLDSQPTHDVTITINSPSGTKLVTDKPRLTFTSNDWHTPQEVVVTANPDSDTEDYEGTITHTIDSSDGNYDQYALSPLNVTVIDNDVPPVAVSFGQASYTVAEGSTTSVKVVLDEDPERTLSIPVLTTLHGGATGIDYSGVPDFVAASAGETEITFVFMAAQDDIDDDGESVILTFGELPDAVTQGPIAETTVSIVDDDVAGVYVEPRELRVQEGATSTYLVALESQPKSEVTVMVNEPADNSDVTATPESLTFTTSNWSEARRVTVSSLQDDDGDDDTATVTHTVTSADPSYSGFEASPVKVMVVDQDEVTVSVSFGRGRYTVTEGSTTTVRVVLDKDPERTISIPVMGNELDGATERDYAGIPPSIEFSPGMTEGSFTFTAFEDGEDDDGESVRITLGNLPDRVSLGAIGTTTVSIVDVNVPSVAVNFEQSTYAVSEGSTTTITVVLDQQPERSVSIPIFITDLGGATSADYTSVVGSVVFGPADTSKSFAFFATDDSVDDDDESVRLSFGDLPHAVVSGSRSEATISIEDDDVPLVSVSFGQAMYSIEESATTSIKVSLSADPERSVTIGLEESPQGGITSDDYSGIPDAITFGPGESERTFTFTASADRTDDDGESLMLSFSMPLAAGVNVGAHGQTAIHIADDDTAGVTVAPDMLRVSERATTSYSVVLDSQPTHAVTVTINSPSGAKIVTDKPRLTFTAADWHVPKKVVVTANPDSDTDDYEGKITHIVDSSDGKYDGYAPSAVSVLVIDNDVPAVAVSFEHSSYSVEEGATTTVKMVLDKDPDRTVTIPIVITEVGGATSTDFSGVPAHIEFAGGEMENAFTFNALQDTVNDDGESVQLTLGDLPDGVSEGTLSKSTVNILDDDLPSVTVSFQLGRYSVMEGATTTVRLSLDRDPERNVVVSIIKTPLNGATSTDFSGVPIQMSFDPGETEKSFTFRAVQDSMDDDDEAVRLSITDLSPQVSLGLHGEAVFEIIDDDLPQVDVSFGQARYTLDEGSDITIAVRLSALPERALEVPIGITHQNGITSADYFGVPGRVAFDADSIESSFTISASQDDIDDDAEAVHLTLGPALPPGVTAVGQAETIVVLVDDDSAGVTVGPTSLTIEERATSSYTVVLDSQPTHGVTVRVQGPAGTEISTDQPRLVFSTSTWHLPQMVTVLAGADEDTVDDEGTITHTTDSLDEIYDGIAPDSVEINVIDNDVPAVTLTFGKATYRVEEGNDVTVEVTLSADPERSLTIRLETTYQGGVSDADFAGVPDSVTFNAGDTVVSFLVSTYEDQLDDDFELVKLSFIDLPDGVSFGAYKETAIAILDNEVPSVAVTFGSGAYRVGEGEEVSVRVVLSADPERTLTIAIEKSNRSGATTRDYSGVPRTLTFGRGETERSIAFAAVQDSLVEGDEAVELSLVGLPEGVSQGTFGDSIVTIVDDDLIPVEVTFVHSSYEVTEGSHVNIRVRLSEDPKRTIRIPILHTGLNGATPRDFSGVPQYLTFRSGDTRKSFTMSAIQDSREEEDEVVELSFGPLPAEVSTGRFSETIVAIADFESTLPAVSFEHGMYEVAEGSTTTVRILLTGAPEVPISVPLEIALEEGATSTDFFGIPNSVTFEQGQTELSIVFFAVEDYVDDDGETVRVRLGDLPSTATAGEHADAVVVIVDTEPQLVTVSFEQSAYTTVDGSTTTVNVVLDRSTNRRLDIPIVIVGETSSTTAERVHTGKIAKFYPGDTEWAFEISSRHLTDSGDNTYVTLALGLLPHGVRAGVIATSTIWGTDESVSVVNMPTLEWPTYVVVEGAIVEIKIVLGVPPDESVLDSLTSVHWLGLLTDHVLGLTDSGMSSAGKESVGLMLREANYQAYENWQRILQDDPTAGNYIRSNSQAREYANAWRTEVDLYGAESSIHECMAARRARCEIAENMLMVGNMAPGNKVKWLTMSLFGQATYSLAIVSSEEGLRG